MDNRFSLYKISDKNNIPFCPEEYSKFKFGDLSIARKFANGLSEAFTAQFSNILLSNEDIVILPSPYLSIPTSSNFLCNYFKNNVNKFLYQHNKKALIESKIYRNQTYVTDYGNLDYQERIKLISNDTYYIDQNYIKNKTCIFVDDIRITGSHEDIVNRTLEHYQVKGEFIFVYFAELVNKEIHPNIENYFNYFFVKGVKDVLTIIQKDEFQFNTRIIKYILRLDKKSIDLFIVNLSLQLLKDIFYLAISNNYHTISEYQDNLSLIHKKTKNGYQSAKRTA
jgi:hypothetical protein